MMSIKQGYIELKHSLVPKGCIVLSEQAEALYNGNMGRLAIDHWRRVSRGTMYMT